MKLSICIPTYERPNTVSSLVNTIINQTKSLNIEIIVCDNSESTSTKKFVKILKLIKIFIILKIQKISDMLKMLKSVLKNQR